jgi:hypothetical protein
MLFSFFHILLLLLLLLRILPSHLFPFRINFWDYKPYIKFSRTHRWWIGPLYGFCLYRAAHCRRNADIHPCHKLDLNIWF